MIDALVLFVAAALGLLGTEAAAQAWAAIVTLLILLSLVTWALDALATVVRPGVGGGR